MKLTRLRLVGFKSFVEPTDFLIEPGLTGVVGPNGCGKSNLVEALRWVMGESSHKSMRASGMDDVIFAGSGEPARRATPPKCTLAIDNADRTRAGRLQRRRRSSTSRAASSARRARPTASTAREVRARDVQLLFADAATGARSPALVRQGQIGEIIAAKPQARRAHPRGGGRHRRAALPPSRGGAAAEGRRGQSRCASTTCCARSTPRSTASKKQAPPGLALQERLGRDPPAEALLFAIGYRRGARAGGGRRARGQARTSTPSPTRSAAQANAATAQAVAAHALPGLARGRGRGGARRCSA